MMPSQAIISTQAEMRQYAMCQRGADTNRWSPSITLSNTQIGDVLHGPWKKQQQLFPPRFMKVSTPVNVSTSASETCYTLSQERTKQR